MKMTNMQGLLEEVKNFPRVELEIEVLNRRQCNNLLMNIQHGVGAIQSMIDGSYGRDVLHQVEQEMLGIVKKARYMVRECCKVDGWCRVVIMQVNNKETFRELLADFEDCFHTMCDISCQTFESYKVEIRDIESSITFYPASVDEVEQDQKAIYERISREVDSCKNENCKAHCTLLRYSMERIIGLQKVQGGELNSLIFPNIYEPPTYGRMPRPLGTGGYGNVYATEWLGFDTATKVIKVHDPEHESIVWREGSILGGLNHPNIIQFFCCGLSTEYDTHAGETKKIEIVMERGIMSLSSFLEKEGMLAESMAIDIMIQIASGMCYLHDMKVAHRDLKPDNVILTSKVGSKLEYVHVKILDFGISKIEVKSFPEVPTNKQVFGTCGYMAPEAHSQRNEPMDAFKMDAFKMDVFSFGMMCYEILSNKRPHFGKNLRDYMRFLDSRRSELPKTCSEGLKVLIRACWSPKTLDRPTFLDISKMLRKLKSDAILKGADDVRMARCFHESTTLGNSIEYSKQCWTMVIQKFHGLNAWLIFVLWQIFITFVQWFSRHSPNFLEMNIILSPSAQENSSITTPNKIPHEVTKEAEQNLKWIGLRVKVLELEKQLHQLGSLGIVGMGGIGKSTLAKALSGHISHQFDATCFVGDFTDGGCTIHVKHKQQDVKGPSQKRTFKEGHEFLKEFQKTKRILVVLDNVLKAKELELLLGDHTWQGVHGSKLIVTSRNWESLRQHVPMVGRVDMETLNEEQSKELFFTHAFATNQPCLPYLDHVVEKIVKACNGLPLSLEVMGRCLYGEKSLRIWERTLQRLLRARNDGSIDKKIWETLRISFDELNKKEQSMFLDMSCFFSKDVVNDWMITNATIPRMYNDDVNIIQRTLESLQDKSLVKFGTNGTLNIHDQLCDMGRMIVEKEFQHTRFWNLSLATFTKYWDRKSIELVEGISFTTFERNDHAFQTSENVKTMTRLRFLSVQNCEDMDMLLSLIRKTSTLKWLKIHFSTFQDEILQPHTYFMEEFMNVAQQHLQQLGVLELFNINISTPVIFENFQNNSMKEVSFMHCTFPHGNFPLGIGNLKLEELNIVSCENLKTFPKDSINLTSLTKLTISRCEALEELPSGLCTLTALEELSFCGCKTLRHIPGGLKGLSSLKILRMFDCEALEEFPSGICTLTTLEELSFSGCKSLRHIPEGLKELSSLKILYMFDCEALEEFPSGICTLTTLEVLSFGGCKTLSHIPEGLKGLPSLKILYMWNCESLKDFPSGICTLKALEELSFGGCKSLRHIPEGLKGLSSLKILRIFDCEALEEFPSGICTLTTLEELSFGGCKTLRHIPEGLKGLSCLKILRMFDCVALEEFPSGICTLTTLEELSFGGCKTLRHIPEGLKGLSSLKILGMFDCEALEEFPSGICTLTTLEELSFSGSKTLRHIPEGLKGLSCLKVLRMFDCVALEEFPSGICTLKALEELSFSGCKTLSHIPEGLKGLSSLKVLRMFDCEALEEFPSGICTLTTLEELSFSGCKTLRHIPEGLKGLSSLKILGMWNCESLEEFPLGICTLTTLEELSFNGCKSLRHIPEGLKGLSSLKILHMFDCEALEEVPSGICTLKALEELSFGGCETLRHIHEGLKGLSSLKILGMFDCEALEEFPSGIYTLTTLEELSFGGCKTLRYIPEGLKGLSSLKILRMFDCEALEEFPSGICTLTTLEELSFCGCKSLKHIPEGLKELSSLKVLHMSNCESLEDFPSEICTLKALEELSFNGCKTLRHVPEGLKGLSSLKILRMFDCEALEEFPSGMCTLSTLEDLSFGGCKSLSHILGGLQGLSSLKILHMLDCEALEDFPLGLCTFTTLQELSVYGCKTLRHFPEGLKGLTSLKILRMCNCEALEEFPSGICTLTKLEELSFNGCKTLRRIPEGLKELNSLKILYMFDCEALEEFPSGICTLMTLEVLSVVAKL